MEITLTFNVDVETMTSALGIENIDPDDVMPILARELDFMRGIGVTLAHDHPKADRTPEPEPEKEPETEPQTEPEVEPEPEVETVYMERERFDAILEEIMNK